MVMNAVPQQGYSHNSSAAVDHFADCRHQIGPFCWLIFGEDFPYVERQAPGSDDMIREHASARDLQLHALLDWYEGLTIKTLPLWGEWCDLDLAPTSSGRYVVVAWSKGETQTHNVDLLSSLRDVSDALFAKARPVDPAPSLGLSNSDLPY